MHFSVNGLHRRYQGKSVLHDVNFQVGQGELVSIVGPSGVGKTTLLRILAGLDAPSAGRIDYAEPLTRDHPVILVFQDYQLFPNLDVAENVEFGLRARGVSRVERQRKVREILGEFGMLDHAAHYPNQLSSGQKQRVALARAMVVRPSLLLLDEPFANLDPSLKMQTADFIRQTQKRFSVTTVSVTHDLEEAYFMSDHIGLMLNGRIVQFCEARDLYHHPVSLDAARFLGPVNVFQSALLEKMENASTVSPYGGTIYARPEGLEVLPDRSGSGVVIHAGFAGHFHRYRVRLNSTEIVVYSVQGGLREGDKVRIRINELMTFTGDGI